MAISDRGGTARITPHLDNMGASQISEYGEIEIPCVPLDYLMFDDVTLIKIDVEWHEPFVLRGAAATIQRNKPLILIEDAAGDYGNLLPDYKLLKAWKDHKTYLYGWNK